MKKFLDQEQEHEGHKTELKDRKAESKTNLFHDFEEHMERKLHEQDDSESLSFTEVEEHLPEQEA